MFFWAARDRTSRGFSGFQYLDGTLAIRPRYPTSLLRGRPAETSRRKAGAEDQRLSMTRWKTKQVRGEQVNRIPFELKLIDPVYPDILDRKLAARRYYTGLKKH